MISIGYYCSLKFTDMSIHARSHLGTITHTWGRAFMFDEVVFVVDVLAMLLLQRDN